MNKKESRGSFLVSIGTSVPPDRYSQQAIANFMISYFSIPEEASRKLSIVYKKSGIDFRHSVLPDFHNNGHLPLLFNDASANPSLSARMRLYESNALNLAAESVKDCLNGLDKKITKSLRAVTHLITVSCTGMSAPGLDIQLMKKLELRDDIERTSVNFMGCYAGFHALKMADAICRSNNEATVLIVMVELCSLHFQPEINSENMVVNSLFSDGAAALLISSKTKLKNSHHPSLRLSGFHSKVIHSGEAMMTWRPSEKGFLMGLDSLVPQLIEEYGGPLIAEALDKFSLKKRAALHWALHPGGRKILEAAQRSINLKAEDLKESYSVLKNFGNMSSPTVFFVLKHMLQERKNWMKKQRIMAAGFGPGITIETALLEPV
ncbi:MAG: type III polyketide synthase, partial [Chitinophagales bacterium]|nr:type III polyketide synthase [Chitinophagales bacterium]